jgi:hypothetical protein
LNDTSLAISAANVSTMNHICLLTVVAG